MLKISEIKMKCDKCGIEKIFKDVETEDINYNQLTITICDMDDENFEGSCECERRED
jgi:hypothetical protein